ncbi:MAG TPA: archease [Acidobacteriota bacterium]|nr:archease [Acidobacteriota bacterium]
MPYQFLEDTATADIAFEASGQTLEEVFIASAEATLNVMIEDLETVRPVEERDISLSDTSLEMLLFNFLQEVIFYKDAEQLLLRTSNCRIEESADGFHLTASGRGERLDPARHSQRVDVKAVTLHQFRLEQLDRHWRAHVILDI